MLAQRATGKDGTGKPCNLRLSSKVVSVDPASGTVTLVTGETISGDVVLGADGVHVSPAIYVFDASVLSRDANHKICVSLSAESSSQEATPSPRTTAVTARFAS